MNDLKYIDKQFLVVFSFGYRQTSFFSNANWNGSFVT